MKAPWTYICGTSLDRGSRRQTDELKAFSFLFTPFSGWGLRLLAIALNKLPIIRTSLVFLLSLNQKASSEKVRKDLKRNVA